MIVYDFVLLVYLLISLPKFLWEMLFKGKYKKGLWQRFGFNLPAFEKKGKTFWIHAVSVGETKAVVPLVKKIRDTYPDSIIIISSITQTGHNEAKASMPFADIFLFFPFDFSFISKKVIKHFCPDVVILSEGDLWYNFLKYAKKSAAQNFIVSGKLSERSAFLYSLFFQRIFKFFDLICVQDELFVERFQKAGVTPEKLKVTGNLKYERKVTFLTTEERNSWQKKLSIAPEQKVITIASSHPGEEELFLEVLSKLWSQNSVKVLLAPRHPERFASVAKLLSEKNIPYTTFSKLNGADNNLILIDTMGFLDTCYQLSDFAIVAGSFVDGVGGHNLLEPIFFGKPVVFGKWAFAQKMLEKIVIDNEAGIKCDGEELFAVLEQLLRDEKYYQSLCHNAEQLSKKLGGALDATWQALRSASPLFR